MSDKVCKILLRPSTGRVEDSYPKLIKGSENKPCGTKKCPLHRGMQGAIGEVEVIGGKISALNYTLISTSTPQGSSSFMRASIVLGFEL